MIRATFTAAVKMAVMVSGAKACGTLFFSICVNIRVVHSFR